jgi:ElaB/YqjD/DUF883 family membrane-anchored ribosome-binding protein
MMTTELTLGHGTIDGKKQQPVKDLRSVAGDTDDSVKDSAGSNAEALVATRTKVEERLGEARARLAQARVAVAEKAKGIAAAGTDYAKENPWKVLGGAAAAGVIVGLLLRRR